MERIEWKFCFTYIQHRVNQQEEYPINPIAQQSALVLMNTMKIVEPSDDQHYPRAKFRGRESPTQSYEFEGSPSWTGMYLHIILFSLIEPMLRAEDRRHLFTRSQFFTGSINLKIMSRLIRNTASTSTTWGVGWPRDELQDWFVTTPILPIPFKIEGSSSTTSIPRAIGLNKEQQSAHRETWKGEAAYVLPRWGQHADFLLPGQESTSAFSSNCGLRRTFLAKRRRKVGVNPRPEVPQQWRWP